VCVIDCLQLRYGVNERCPADDYEKHCKVEGQIVSIEGLAIESIQSQSKDWIVYSAWGNCFHNLPSENMRACPNLRVALVKPGDIIYPSEAGPLYTLAIQATLSRHAMSLKMRHMKDGDMALYRETQ